MLRTRCGECNGRGDELGVTHAPGCPRIRAERRVARFAVRPGFSVPLDMTVAGAGYEVETDEAWVLLSSPHFQPVPAGAKPMVYQTIADAVLHGHGIPPQ